MKLHSEQDIERLHALIESAEKLLFEAEPLLRWSQETGQGFDARLRIGRMADALAAMTAAEVLAIVAVKNAAVRLLNEPDAVIDLPGVFMEPPPRVRRLRIKRIHKPRKVRRAKTTAKPH